MKEKLMPHRISRRALACVLFATTALASPLLVAAPAQAQVFTANERRAPDGNGVDVISGKVDVPMRAVSIGRPGESALAYVNGWIGGEHFDTFNVELLSNTFGGTVPARILVFGQVKRFTDDGAGTWTNADGDGATFVYDAPVNGWIYTARDGTVVKFLRSLGDTGWAADTVARVSTITFPHGEVWTYNWRLVEGVNDQTAFPEPIIYPAIGRVQSITSNLGFQLKATYAQDTINTDGSSNGNFSRLTKVTAINNTVDYCNPSADSCSFTQSWPAVTIGISTSGATTTQTFTDSNSQTTSVRSGSSGVTQVVRPMGTDADVTYDASGRVATFARGGGTWTYSYSDNGTQRTTTVTQPLGGSKIYVTDLNLARLLSITDELGRTTSYQYDSFGRLTDIIEPEGNKVQYTYDARGNVTEERHVAKAGPGPDDIVMSASFPASCANPKTCNQPSSRTNARGNTTDYTYEATHGGVLTATSPAPTIGAVRPKATYGYTALSAYYKNSAGVIVAAPSSVTKLTSVSACQTLASCSGGADEVKLTLTYGSSGVANNLYVTSVSSGAGNGSLTATGSATYDQVGNMRTLDGPLAGSADTGGFQYDADRQLTVAISPDPDGAGALKMRARRFTYDGNGQVTKVEVGTAPSLTGAFTPITGGERVEIAYDSLGRRSKLSLISGILTPAIQALTQYSYDAKGRLTCTAVRMNPAVFGTVTSDACVAGTAGSNGPDRITKLLYDNADAVTQLQVAVGTSDAANELTLTYTDNGEVRTLKDAENNLTTYVYDGFDRLSKTCYPVAIQGASVSSTSDCEQLSYDANSNVTSFRLGQSIAFSYDQLDRVALKDLPGTEPDVSYAYDLLGRLTAASQTGNALSFTYDALSRNLTQAGPHGTVTSAYDLAGRRTQLVYPAGGTALTIDYNRLTTGEISAIKQGTTALATYAYDDLGRRTSVTFANAVVQTYTYDPVSRLTSLTNDLASTANDLTIGTIAYNPASQIVSRPTSNDAYVFGKSAISETGTANGLNQLTSYAGKSLSHDGNGNVSAFGSDSYGYSSENLLTSATVGGTSTTLAYDPAMRLYQTSSGASVSRFAYDGLNALAEYNNAGTLQRRWVFDDAGQPLVWYEGTGTGAIGKRYLSADERGSIISVSNSTGASLGINAYDEFGKAGTLTGRFGYTGQAWLPSVKLWYYKTRVYSADAGGRFLQPDPIGYADSPNLYAYVTNDPVNLVDPLGLDGEPPIVVTGQRCPEGWTCYDPGYGFQTIQQVVISRTPSGGGGGEIVVTGRRRAVQPAVLLPGPFSGNPDPNVTCDQAGCDAGVVITRRRHDRDSKLCRGAVAAAVAVGLGVGATRAIIHDGEAIRRMHKSLAALDYVKAGSRGARLGAAFGMVGAGAGFVTFAAGVYLWDRYHEDIFDALCGG